MVIYSFDWSFLSRYTIKEIERKKKNSKGFKQVRTKITLNNVFVFLHESVY